MKINQFFTETLGANCRNKRWSWGAVDPAVNRVFLRVWKDQIVPDGDGERVRVALDMPTRKSSGFAERKAHVMLIGGTERVGSERVGSERVGSGLSFVLCQSTKLKPDPALA